MYGDIDRFKVFNDLHGIEAGDLLLSTVGKKMVEVLPENALAAHLRGDHFIVCLPRDRFDAEMLTASINEWLNAYPVDFSFFVRLGIYEIDNPELDVVLMSDRALLALREAKKDAQKQYAFYHEGLREHLLKEQETAGEMELALKERQFVPFFQPQYCYPSRILAGAEVLARWNHPTKGLLSPAEFIPVFERNGLISRFDYYMWEEACRSLREMLDTHPVHKVPHLSVNFSRVDIYQTSLCQKLCDLANHYHVPLEMLHIEITESAYMEAPDQLIGVVQELCSAGFTVEMDDFGSGYSSLNTLKDVPVDILKLDMRFLDARNNTRGGIILASIARMARWLNLPIIAEGVETRTQADYLASIGCEVMQGYWFNHPVDRATFDALLTSLDDQGVVALKQNSTVSLDQDVWDVNSQFALLFSHFTGASAIAEYSSIEHTLEIVRGSDEFQVTFADLLPRNETYKTNVLSILSEEDQLLICSDLEHIKDEGGATQREVCVSVKNSDPQWIRFRLRPLSRAADVCTVFLQCEEITEKQVLRDRFRATIESIPGGIAFFEVRKDSIKLIDFSDAAAELSDCTRAQFIELAQPDARELVHPEHLDDVQGMMEGLFSGQRRRSATVRVKRYGGGYRWVYLSSSIAYRSEDTVCIAVSLVDATEERESQVRSERRVATQEHLFNAIPCAIIRFVVGDELEILSFNKTGYEMLGCASFEEYLEYVQGAAFGPTAGKEMLETQQAIVKALLEDPTQIVPFSFLATRKDGSTLWVEGISSITVDEQDRQIIQSAFNDVTYRRAEQHRQNMQHYTDVLCSVYDEIFEINVVQQVCRVVHSVNNPHLNPDPQPIEEAFERWFCHIPRENEREELRRILYDNMEMREHAASSWTYKFALGDRVLWCQSTFLRVSDEVILCCTKDVSERILGEGLRARVQVSDVISKLPVGVAVYQYENEVLTPMYLSDLMCKLFGTTSEAFDGLTANGKTRPADPRVAEAIEGRNEDVLLGVGFESEITSHLQDGAPIDVRVSGKAAHDKDGNTTVYVVAADITEEIKERKEALWLNERYRLLSEITGTISFDYDSETDTVLFYIDCDGEGMKAQVISQYMETLSEVRKSVIQPEYMETVREMFEKVKNGADTGIIEYQADYYGTGYEWYRTHLLTVRDDSGSWHLVGLIDNVQDEKELRRRADFDETTGLTNHATTKDLVNLVLADPNMRTNSICAVLDIDDFKHVNDTCGHIEGDALLREMGMALKTSFRESDVVGRVGGDEFALLLKNIGLETALRKFKAVAQRVKKIKVPNSNIISSISVGIYEIEENDTTYRDAFVKADDALYRAKRAGKDRIYVYEESARIL